jgi:4-hydroxythreonine-4-phosphate dehydrogenase
MKPIIGISCGDTNGVGPEIILKTLSDERITEICTPIIFGPTHVFNEVKNSLDLKNLTFNRIDSIEEVNPKKINFFNCSDSKELNFGVPDKNSGNNAKEALIAAGKFLIDKKIDGLVTAPIDKSNIQSEEFQFPGHTEFLGSLDSNNSEIMLMISEKLKVAMYSGHIPLSEVSKSLDIEKLKTKVGDLQKILKQDFSIRKPKIAILGVNPHAGDNGLLGEEDEKFIKPVVKEFTEKGELVYGPFPADGFFGNGTYQQFDAVLAIYHDQGLIPFKTLSFGNGTNFTAGLSFVRTSPDHGTAFDIAGQNKANNTSFKEALYKCIDIIKERRVNQEISANPLKSKPSSTRAFENRRPQRRT